MGIEPHALLFFLNHLKQIPFMLKRTTVAVLYCLLSLTAVWAGERSDQEMRTIALQQLAANQANTRGAALESDICELARRASYSVYGLSQGQGFVVVSRSTAFHPVLATSETRFDADNLPDGLKWWLDAIDESLMTREAAAPTRAYTAVENFIQTQWGQGDPYNSMTPEIGGKHTPTGCVATAMAQILKYYNYPEKSEGISYYNIGDDPTDIRNEFNTTFKWDQILVSYKGSDYGEEARQAVGELMRDCGYSVKMQYDRGGSGALYTNAALGFVRNMCFREGYVHNANRDFYTDAEWMEIVEREMTAHRPILYGGNNGKDMGHAFVFSGLDEDGKVYVNWGWEGSGDGYYDIANLAPTGTGVTSSYDFSKNQHMVYGLTPEPDLAVFRPKYSEWAFMEGNYTLTPSTVAGRVSVGAQSSLYNFYYTTFRGTIDLVVISKETGKNDTFTIYETEGVQPYYGLNFSLIPTNKRLVNLKNLPAGIYLAYLGSKAHSDVEYQPLRSTEGTIAYEITISEDGSISVSDPMRLIVTDIRSPKVVARTADAFYDLQGRRVSDPQRHGIYILNGKKVIR